MNIETNEGRMKKITIFLCAIFLFQNIFAEELSNGISKKNQKINTLLPGYYQIQDGRTAEGFLYMSSLPIIIGANALILPYLLQEQNISSCFGDITNYENEHYFWYVQGFEQFPNKWMWFTGNTLNVFGTLLYAYSQYDAFYHEEQAREDAVPQIELLEAMSAPWKPENVFNLEVLPVLTLESGYNIYGMIDSGALKEYFSRDSVSFLGNEMSPPAALASVLLSSMVFVTGNATVEEFMF